MRHATHRRAFQHALAEFVAIIRSVPDYPPAAVSLDEMHSLTAAAQSVIDDIEHRVIAADDSVGVQVTLVETVYAIRGGLEEMDRWQRHFLCAR